MPKIRSRLAERILSEEQVQRMLALETNKRNHALLRLLYTAGLRVSEVCDLTWRDIQARGTTGQVTVYGKGSKERAVLLSPETYGEVMELRGSADDTAPVFLSRKHGHLNPVQVRRIVTDAARRAGINGNVSPHWLRHAHASHSLDRGAPINLVRETLGHASPATTGKYTHARPNASSSQFLPL